MESRDLIKYAAYGVAAYVVYRYVASTPWFQALMAGAATGAHSEVPQTGGNADPATSTKPAQTTTPASAPATDETYLRAVVDETFADQLPVTIALTPDQWNWYRAKATGNEQPDPLLMGFTPGSRAFPITARQYWMALRSLGLSGMAWQPYDARVVM